LSALSDGSRRSSGSAFQATVRHAAIVLGLKIHFTNLRTSNKSINRCSLIIAFLIRARIQRYAINQAKRRQESLTEIRLRQPHVQQDVSA